ncbi:hypothetical protein ACPVBQ_005059, partial [Escherichia coli]
MVNYRLISLALTETLGEQYDPALPSALRQSSARKPLPPHFPEKPGLSGRKRNAVLPVVANSV